MFYYNFMFFKYLWLKIIFVPFCLWKLHAVGQSIQAYWYEAPIDWNFHIIFETSVCIGSPSKVICDGKSRDNQMNNIRAQILLSWVW